jgi:hypothetical protein
MKEATAAAPHEAREHMLGSARHVLAHAAIGFLPRLDRIPKIVVDDPQIGSFDDLPLLGRVRS